MAENQLFINYAKEIKMLASSLLEDIKDSESATVTKNKIDRFYHDVGILRNNMKEIEKWVKTDDLQYLQKVSDNEYVLAEARYAEDQYIICSGHIDLDDYLNNGTYSNECVNIIKTYYSTVENFESNYTDYELRNQILAEMLFEETAYYELDYILVPEGEEESALLQRIIERGE